MSAVSDISEIQNQKAIEMASSGVPPLNAEGLLIMEKKRMSLDEPPMVKKADPMR